VAAVLGPVRGLGGQDLVKIFKVKAHATEADVQAGRTSKAHRYGNNMADARGKQAARAKGAPRKAAKMHLEANKESSYLARWIAKAGQQASRLDNDGALLKPAGRPARLARAERSANTHGHSLLPQMGHPSRWVCLVCQSAASTGSDIWQRECPSTPAKRAWELSQAMTAAGHRPHNLVEVEAPMALGVACTACGAYGRRTLRLLGRPCRRRPAAAGKQVLLALDEGRMPHTATALRSAPLRLHAGCATALCATTDT